MIALPLLCFIYLIGAKRSCSTSTLPLRVDTKELDVSSEFLQKLNKHMMLLFTGKARLARNLLQNVVRRWFARLPETVQTIQELKVNADAAAKAFESEDIEQIGACLRKYWSVGNATRSFQKCNMLLLGPTRRRWPKAVNRPLCHGYSKVCVVKAWYTGRLYVARAEEGLWC